MKKLEIGGNLFIERPKIDPETKAPVIDKETGLPEMEQVPRSMKSELIRILKQQGYKGFEAIEMHEIIQKISEQEGGFIVLDKEDYQKIRTQIDNPQSSYPLSYVPLLKAIRDAADIDPKDIEPKPGKKPDKGGEKDESPKRTESTD